MAGRIRADDIALVRERVRIDEIVGAQLQLRNAGGGSMKGLCPFHDEKSPSFHVTPAKGFWHCFGCGLGGDVIDFVMKIDHLLFAEAVERLASRSGVQLRYEEGGSAPQRQTGQRSRLLAANAAAAAFYADQLGSGEAAVGRRFLEERGFDRAAAATFGVGYAPGGWDTLTKHLRGQQFSEEELRLAGLARDARHGLIDRFRERLVWPIRDLSGDVVGFGARKLSTDSADTSPKYLNTPETAIYKKSQILYGVDLAKGAISKEQRAVVVEGYTDVMACHLAGVPTAVATCGTAFGEEHTRILRRLLMDQDEFRGEVIFTFDGDVAGQKAALRAFEGDQRFATQTFVAIQADGLDPCDLRLAKGDAAVRDLVADRVPLFEFAVRTTLERHNLETTEGRMAALDAVAPIVADIRDRGMRQRYAINVDRWLGFLDEKFVLDRVAQVAARRNQPTRGGPGRPAADARPGDRRDERDQRSGSRAPRGRGPESAGASGPGSSLDDGHSAGSPLPDPRDPAAKAEREALKLAVQHPDLVGAHFDTLDTEVFSYAVHEAIHAAIVAAGGTGAAADRRQWVHAVREQTSDEVARGLVSALAVEPLLNNLEPTERYAAAVMARVEEVAATRRVTQLKSKLQRINPVDEAETYNRLFGQLVALERERIALRERAIGGL